MTTHTDLSRDMDRERQSLKEEGALTRAEWMAAAALGLSLLQGTYIAGVEVQRLNDHDRRIGGLEVQQDRIATKVEEIRVTSARIDANVAALAEITRERRGGNR
jgi:hypothetical protein